MFAGKMESERGIWQYTEEVSHFVTSRLYVKVAHNYEKEGKLYMVIFYKQKSVCVCGVHLYWAPLSQYFFKPPSAAITAASLLECVSAGFT